MNSFQAIIKLKKPATAMPGRVSGATLRQNTPNVVSPSTRPA